MPFNEMDRCPKCKSTVSPEDLFCGMCGTKLVAQEQPLYQAGCSRRGIILTDTYALAIKLQTPHKVILEILDHYVQSLAPHIAYRILDLHEQAASSSFLSIPYKQKPGWEECHKILYKRHLATPHPDTEYLFIIGGDDIIPIPEIPNHIMPGAGDTVPSDLLYGYFDPILAQVNINTVIKSPQQYYVGRLPLGTDATLLHLQEYLERAIPAIETGIPVQMAYAQCDPSWKLVSNAVVNPLRQKELIPDIEADPSLAFNSIFLSPYVTDDNIDKAFNPYANLYYFNLHGSSQPETPCFIGRSDDEEQKAFAAIYPTAFQYAQLDNIVVTEACYGGKHQGLPTDKSMLLSSISHSTLLYLGSSITAYGLPDKCYLQTPLLYGADIMAQAFVSHLMAGYTAGEALALTHDLLLNQSVEVGETAAANMLTVLEFSLYGDPSLKAHFPGQEPSPRLVHRMEKSENAPDFHCEELYNEAKSTSILSMVRNRIDSRLQELNEGIQQELAQYGVRPRKLSAVFRIRYGSLSQQLFAYTTDKGDHPVVVVKEGSKQLHLFISKSGNAGWQSGLTQSLSINYEVLFRRATQRFRLVSLTNEGNTILGNTGNGNLIADMPPISLDGRIERKSKVLVKTFNTVLATIYRPSMERQDIPLLACKSCEYDFSLLVNPLSVLLETELRLSVIKYFALHGIKCPEKATFGGILHCMKENSSRLPECGLSPRLTEQLKQLHELRNEAAHRGGIDETHFLSFYKNFVRFVTSSAFSSLMELKMKLKNK